MKLAVYSIGFWGAPNLGDELLANCLLDAIKNLPENGSIQYFASVRSAKSEHVTFRDQNVELVNGWYPSPRYFLSFADHVRAILTADIITVGGGGLLNDKYSWKSIPRYSIDPLLALVLGKHYVFVGIGAPRIQRPWLRSLAKFVYSNAEAIYCRDVNSQAELKQLKTRTKVLVAPDLAVTYRKLRSSDCITTEDCPQNFKHSILINLRENDPYTPDEAAQICEEKLRHAPPSAELILIGTEPHDERFCYEIIARLKGPAAERTRYEGLYHSDDAVRIIKTAAEALITRLHLAFMALHLMHIDSSLEIIPYEPKVVGLLDAHGIRSEVDNSRSNIVISRADFLIARGNLANLATRSQQALSEALRLASSSTKHRLPVRMAALLWFSFLTVAGVLSAALDIFRIASRKNRKTGP